MVGNLLKSLLSRGSIPWNVRPTGFTKIPSSSYAVVTKCPSTSTQTPLKNSCLGASASALAGRYQSKAHPARTPIHSHRIITTR